MLVTEQVGMPRGQGLLGALLCGLLALRGGEARLVGGSLAGLCGRSGGGEGRVAGPGAVRPGWRVWGTGWGVKREGQVLWGCVRVWCVGAPVRLQQCLCVVSCRAGGFGGGACRLLRPRQRFSQMHVRIWCTS